jgi:hypothetical protein
MATTVSAERTPTMWLNFPLDPSATYRRGEMLLPGDAHLAGSRSPAVVGDLPGGGQFGAEDRSQGGELFVLIRLDACPQPDHHVGAGQRLDVIVTSARHEAHTAARRDRPRCVTVRSCGALGGNNGSTPGRTDTIERGTYR